jgi:hypothetical protein
MRRRVAASPGFLAANLRAVGFNTGRARHAGGSCALGHEPINGILESVKF